MLLPLPRLLRARTLPPTTRLFHGSASLPTPLLPALVRRAQSLADEHAALTTQLAESYTTSLARRAGTLLPITTALTSYNAAHADLTELRTLLSDRHLDPELRSLAEDDLAGTTETVANLATTLTHALVPPHRFAHLPALVEIRPGTGGSEAAIFASDLHAMYTRLCNTKNWPMEQVAMSRTDDASGIIEAIFEVPVPAAYDFFRTEAGVHRVQRIPATETKGRVHTSTANVIVLPSFPVELLAEGEEDPDSVIDPKDIRTEVMRARGAGGQHVNTTDSAVRMTHIPTGIVAAIQDSRSQLKNREKCLSVLKSRIAEKRRGEREAEEQSMRRGATKVGAGRSDKMRTYNYSQSRVTDHRTLVSLHDLPGCMEGEGGLEGLMEGVRKWMVEKEVEVLMAEEEAKEKEKKAKK